MREAKLLVVAAAALLSACSTTTNPVPEDYSGPLAMMSDSYVKSSRNSLDFFFLDKVDGKDAPNSLRATIEFNEGLGYSLMPKMIDRAVPAKPSTFTITGTTRYAAPIFAIGGTVYRISGDVTFTPLPDHIYVVKGILSEQYSGVWVEDSRYHTVMGRKIEVQGSTAQGFFSK